MKKPELLIPASSLEVLKTAVIFGADAVYIGGDAFGLRAKAKNFSHDEMKEGIEFAHEHGVKVHVTVNTILTDEELIKAKELIKQLYEIGVDAIIVQDMGLINKAIKKSCHQYHYTQVLNVITEH